MPKTEIELENLVAPVAMRLPQVLDEVAGLLEDKSPDYAQFIRDHHDEVAMAVVPFAQRLVDLARYAEPDAPTMPEAGLEQALFEEIGRGQYRDGNDLTELLAAYQVGARVVWRHVAAAALEVGLAQESVAALAGVVFMFVDQLSSASARGFVLEQSETAATRQRRRDELSELLLSDRSDSDTVRAAAHRAGWVMPRQAAVILSDPDDELAHVLVSRVDQSALQARQPGVLVTIVPDPAGPGRRQRLAIALRGSHAVIGHPVPLEGLPTSLHIAEEAMRLARDGVIVDDPVFVEDHLDSIIVHRDDRLLTALRRQMLEPLSGLTAGSRARLIETLTCWLRHMGDRRAIADELHVHPQTVRYRLGRLRELFGEALDDPVTRSRLMLALAWEPELRPADPPAPAAGLPGSVPGPGAPRRPS